MFRKLLDQGQAGDNVGILLRGTKREEVERGQVLCKPGSIKPHTHFTAEVYVLARTRAGATRPSSTTNRPQFYSEPRTSPGPSSCPRQGDVMNTSASRQADQPDRHARGLRLCPSAKAAKTVGSASC